MARNLLISDEVEDQNTAALKRRMTSRASAGQYDNMPLSRLPGPGSIAEKVQHTLLPLLIRSAVAIYCSGYLPQFSVNVEFMGLEDDMSLEDYCMQHDLQLPENIHRHKDGLIPAVYWLATALEHMALPDIVNVIVTEGKDGSPGIILQLPEA